MVKEDERGNYLDSNSDPATYNLYDIIKIIEAL